MDSPAEQLRQAADAVARLGCSSADYEALTDAAALAGQKDIATARRLLETRAAWMAATIADRSRPELGHSGLAAQQGFLSPEAMIQKVTGASKNEAFKLVAVGTMLAQAEAADRQAADGLESPGVDGTGAGGTGADGTGVDGGAGDDSGGPGGPGSFPPDPAGARSWQAPIARAVTAGTLSVDAAESIRKGLGDIDTAVTADTLATALSRLLAEAGQLNADQCFTRARRMRDDLDQAGIAAREKQAYDDRFLKVYRLANGMVRLHGLFAPEDGEFVLSTYDSITSPRRGGVRFVDPKRKAWAKAIQDDPRSTAQIAADSFVQLLKIAGEVDPGQMLGGRRPAVRIIVTQKDLTNATHTNTGAGTGTSTGTGSGSGSRNATQAPSSTSISTPSTPHLTEAPEAPGAAEMPADSRPIPAVKPDTAAPSTQPGQPSQPDMSGQPDQPGQPGQPDLSGEPGQPGQPAETGHSGQPSQSSQSSQPSQPVQPGQPGTALVLATGHGSIEGSPAPISLATVQRQLCDTGYLGILFDNTGQPIDVGREQRLFTPAQRTAMGARDGGCVWPDCDRPPAWTEAHHLKQWLLEHGYTDLADGVCLCHPHHLLLHNTGWVILRGGDQYWLKPPASVDPKQTLIPLPSKTHRQLDQGTPTIDRDTD
ncbi:DUF222 domain-containing protein [Cryobacterium sp. HLT2-28]|uniref:DUF222 domain-containing protein n=1 Tax=Cryobacterium sp. HLT2-28 TaxID=1259146 RepID=UPI00106B5E94|nr:DUF222 domain-containing protein [Cryobacterium sp. HLT2-28]TFB91479.1 DUF222 domain-containing protein [Cryobacterium sp. HLT2-28]